jgi:hypothetical protein
VFLLYGAYQVGICHVLDQTQPEGGSRYAKAYVVVGQLGSDVRLRSKASRRRIGAALDGE